MSQIVLNVEDKKLPILLDLLGRLDYVNIISEEENTSTTSFEIAKETFTESDYMYGFGLMKDKPNFTIEKIRKKAWHRKW
ncbi:MAG: hypothetical protein ACPG49_08100 [Chitinophagales bacterium]